MSDPIDGLIRAYYDGPDPTPEESARMTAEFERRTAAIAESERRNAAYAKGRRRNPIRVVAAVAVVITVAGLWSVNDPAPAPALGRFELPRFGSVEHVALVTECMADAGFEISFEELGDGMRQVSSGSASEGQQERESEALRECLTAPVEAGRVAPMPTEVDIPALEHVFRHWVDVVLPCMDAAGYPTNPPPSQEVFVESHLARSDDSWHPMDALPGWNAFIARGAEVPAELREQVEAAARARAECPTVPPA